MKLALLKFDLKNSSNPGQIPGGGTLGIQDYVFCAAFILLIPSLASKKLRSKKVALISKAELRQLFSKVLTEVSQLGPCFLWQTA
jgi:hypothetical protein